MRQRGNTRICRNHTGCWTHALEIPRPPPRLGSSKGFHSGPLNCPLLSLPALLWSSTPLTPSLPTFESPSSLTWRSLRLLTWVPQHMLESTLLMVTTRMGPAWSSGKPRPRTWNAGEKSCQNSDEEPSGAHPTEAVALALPSPAPPQDHSGSVLAHSRAADLWFFHWHSAQWQLLALQT